MIQPNGESLSRPDQPRKGKYTGERLKMLRPEIYRRVLELLAEPREHVSIREICRQCHVTDDTVKAVEKREAIPIAARKQALMVQAARIDLISDALPFGRLWYAGGRAQSAMQSTTRSFATAHTML